ncbi:uncharacterized protein LOC113360569 [Papaver somniferum]|uniref:uncharacterized protein LOC113360569 n=1 Tax=Papaver somniferum TaxID=3469 RepID=UPI000E6F984E|nr:uncharacterized protein LOC113360569 [Papaver somniferum]
MLDSVPSDEEIKNIVFNMDPESSPGPDGFSGCFYRSCWQIIHEDVVQAIQYCWKRKFIPKGLNSSFLVLLPKVQGAKTPNQFRPIGLSNLSFKIITKIMTVRMSTLMEKLVAPQQAAYIKGRCIQEQVLLASEMVNEMKKKKEKRCWCEWLHVIFKSARISLLINGGPCGFFQVSRGLRKGDPLSPILFVLMEEVLSRKITQLVSEGKITLMVIRKGIGPTHLFFADDVFMFCNGGKKCLQQVQLLLEAYQKCLGQIINKIKSKLFIDGTSILREKMIQEIMQMELSEFPDKYLGVILAAGRVKSSTVWPMVEMLQGELAIWKGKMLSFQESLVLIKSVLCSIPMYNMAVYKRPSTVIKICEKIIRNFLWSGDGEVRKSKTLAWKKVCTPLEEGGLAIPRLGVINREGWSME